MQQLLMFKLDQDSKGRGLRCDSAGLFLGGEALLGRNAAGNFEARPGLELRKTFDRIYGDDADWESRIRSVRLVASALNKGEMARAMMTAVLMRLPDPASPIRIADADGVLEKAGYNPGEPRDQRGRWANLLDEAEAALAEIGRAQTVEANADLAVANAEVHAVAQAYDAYSRWMEHPVGGEVPITPETPIWGYGPTAENAPTRPITRGDMVGAATSLLATLPGGEAASGAAGISEFAIPESEAFIIRPLELPPNFNPTLPVGRYAIPADVVPGTTTYGNLVGGQIGKLFQDSFPDVQMTLRTSPGMKGVDIEIPFDNAKYTGFQYAEIKPVTDYGLTSFNAQIKGWKLPAPVQVISYDYQGNIYYGFPR